MGCFCDEHILFLNLEGKRELKKNQMGYLTDGKLIFFVWRKFLQINNKDNTPTKRKKISQLRALQFSSVTQLCPTLCDLMNRSTPGLPVHHQLPEFTQPHMHRVGDAIQPSHPLSSPSPPAPNPSQHQSLFE